MFYYNALNLNQVGGGNRIKQGDFGSRFSYKLTNEKKQELDNFDKEVAYINLVLNDKIVFTTTATVDKSTVTFNINKAIPVGLYFLEIKIGDYIFPSDRQTIIFVESGSVAYDLKDLVPNYDTNMTLSSILSDLSQKGIDISDLKTKMSAIYSNALADHAEVAQARGTHPNLRAKLDEMDNKQEQTTIQLAQKVEIGKVTKHDFDISQDSRKLGLENFSDAVLRRMAGNTPVNSTPARYSTTSEKIAKGAVGTTGISDQLNEMLYVDQTVNFEIGTLLSANGTESDNPSRIRSDGFIDVQKGVVSFYDFGNNAKYLVFYYDTNSEAFIKKTEWIKDAFLEIDQPYKIKLVLAYDDDRDIGENFDDLVSKLKVKTSDVAMLLTEQRKNTIGNISWEMGTVSSTNGWVGDSGNRIRTKERTLFKKGTILHLNDNKKFKIAVVEYSQRGNSLKDYVSGTGFLEGNYTFPKDMIAHVVMAKRDDSVIESVESVSGSISFLPVSQSGIYKVVDDKLEKIKNNINTDRLGSKGEFKFKFDVDAGSSYMSSHCMVDDELWVFPVSDDANHNYSVAQRHTIDFSNNTQSFAGTFEHNWGHVNSISYNRFTDSLILGNGSSSYSLYGKILIFENASTFKTKTRVDVSESIQIDVSSFGVKANVVWGDSNNGKGNICYVITNDNKNIRKLLLGQGANQLENGAFISGKTGLQYNGTYKILAEYSQADGDDVCQGSCYFGGKLYIGLGHDALWYTENELHDDGTITKATVREIFYKDNGKIDPKVMQGVTVTDNHILVGLQYGATNEIYVYSK